MTSVELRTVLTGEVRPLSAEDARLSGIDKHPVTGKVEVHRLGLRGDHQADLEAHGGVDKAIHHYAFDHYPAWRDELPEAAERLARVGAFGENFSTLGWTEHDVCLGDVVSVGSAKLQVSHGRQPCWKLNVRFALPDMLPRVTRTGRCGWYYRVLEPGWVEAGDRLELLERPHSQWTIARLFAVLFGPEFERADLLALLDVPELADAWRERTHKRLRRSAG